MCVSVRCVHVCVCEVCAPMPGESSTRFAIVWWSHAACMSSACACVRACVCVGVGRVSSVAACI